MEAWYRLESVEHYAMILMYTGNIIGKANVLSCDQVRELVKIREKLGIRTGGLPSCCVDRATNLADVGGLSGGARALCAAGGVDMEAARPAGGGAPAGTAGPADADISSRDIEPIVREVLSALLPLAHGKTGRMR
jgi:L-fuculose-phosphate aldolase